MRKVAKVGWFLIICMFVSGCSMLQQAVTHGATHGVALTAVEMLHNIKQTVEDTFRKYSQKLGLPNLDIEIYEYEPASSDPNFRVEFLIEPFEGEILFSPSKYLANDSRLYSAYVLALASYLESIEKHLHDTDIEVKEINVEFQGGADGLGYSGPVARYRGECGKIEERFLIGGADKDIVIHAGDLITNIVLAAVRAYCMYDDFRSKTEKLEITEGAFNDISFIANEYKGISESYRFARIVISMKKESKSNYLGKYIVRYIEEVYYET